MPYGFNNDKSKYELPDTSNLVTGVKGDNETDYRSGQINITKANIGLGNVENRKITSGTATPSGGSNGDIHIQY